MEFQRLKVNFKSPYLRESKSGGNRKKSIFMKFAHFLVVSRDEQKCIFLFFHFRLHGNHDFLFLALFSYVSKLKFCIFELPCQRGHIRNVCVYANRNRHG